jgi:REP element-mobilizing transposase RayT
MRTYFLTWTTYATWLPGDPRGSFINDRLEGAGKHKPKPNLEHSARDLLRHDPVILSDDARAIVEASIQQHAEYRAWTIHALNVRTNHVHTVLTIDRPADKAMSELKARATRALREAGLFTTDTTLWTQHGSTRHLHTEESRLRAMQYVIECQ